MEPRPTRRTSSGLSTDIVELALTVIWYRKRRGGTRGEDVDCRKIDWTRGVAVDNLDSIYICYCD